MTRPKLLLTSLLLAGALVISMGITSGGASTPPVPLQDSAPSAAAGEEAAPAAADLPVTPLAGIAVESPSRPWITELRIPVVIENPTPFPLPADLSILGGLGFSLRDTDGNRHPVATTDPQVGVQPNHSLSYLDPGISARWILGFTVPTAVATNLTLELHSGEVVAASWPVDGLPGRINAATVDRNAAQTVGLGQQFAWAEDVAATAVEVGSLICGDPAIETVTQVFAVAFDVANSGAAEFRWPGYVHRDGGSVAQWFDGTAAEMTMETYVGDAETLPRVSTFAVRIPPRADARRALVFAAPRDGRFADVTTLPGGVALRTGGDDVWLDLDGVSATLPMSPTFCDLGFLGAPVPFGFAPGSKYSVGGEPAMASAADRNGAAEALITEALAGAALYYDSHGQTFASVSGDDLVAAAPRITFVAHEVGDEISGDVGVVYFSTRPDDGDFLYVVTRSASGRWFCAGITAHRVAITRDGTHLEDIAGVCYPETLVEDAG